MEKIVRVKQKVPDFIENHRETNIFIKKWLEKYDNDEITYNVLLEKILQTSLTANVESAKIIMELNKNMNSVKKVINEKQPGYFIGF